MDIRIFPNRLGGYIKAKPSKSAAHRAIICAALSDRPTLIKIECEDEGAAVSDDISATIACVNALGAAVERAPGGLAVYPAKAGGHDGDQLFFPCGESGSTFRFMLPIAAALGREAAFELKGRLPERPLSPLYEELVRHGCALSPQSRKPPNSAGRLAPFHSEERIAPFRCSGRLAPGAYALDAGVSSQFISGLLFALPLLDGDSELRLTGSAESFSYVKMTMVALKTFGIRLEYGGGAFAIPGGQAYRSPGVYEVEGDWSNAAFWLCAGALSDGGMAESGAFGRGAAADGSDAEDVTCGGLDLRSPQGDKTILDLLERFGARVKPCESGVAVSGGHLRGLEIDARDIPDLVPALAVVGAVAQGVTAIRGAARLRDKESDRLAAVTAALRALGSDISETADGLHIRGVATLKGGCVSSRGDHRIAMAAATAASACAQPVVIRGAEAVNKSYPGFYNDLRALGGVAQVIQEYENL